MTARARTLCIAGVLAATTLVAGCSGGSGSAAAASGPTAAAGAVPTGAPGGGPGGQNPQEFAAIRQCLQAAGVPLPSIDPSRRFSPGARPSGSPRPRPTGSDARRGGRGLFADPAVQAALKACGITLPTGGFGPRRSGAPGAPPSGT